MKKVIIWTLIVVCIAGFAGWYFWLRDGGTNGGTNDTENLLKNLSPEEVFTPPPPGEEPEGEPFLIDATKHLDPSNLPQSGVIREWQINLKAVVLAVSGNHLTLAPISGKVGNIEAIGNKEVELIISEKIKITKHVSAEETMELKLKDLKPGDILRIYVWWQKDFGLEPHGSIRPYCVGYRIQNVDITKLETTTVPILWRGTAIGGVQEVSGRTLTIVRAKETIDIPIREDARITMMCAGSDIPWKLERVKKGDSAFVSFVLTEEKELEGISVSFWRHG